MQFRRVLGQPFDRFDSARLNLYARGESPGDVLTFSGLAVFKTQARPIAPAAQPPAQPPTQPPSQPPAQPPAHPHAAQPTKNPVQTTSVGSIHSSDDTFSTSSAAAPDPSSSQPSSTSVLTPSTTPTSISSLTLVPSTTERGGSTAVQNAATGAVSLTSATAGGMSPSAKAGLALGLIIIFALFGASAFTLYRQHKPKLEGRGRLDEQKVAMTVLDALPSHPEPEPTMAPAAPLRSQTAPYLSDQPVSQFDRNFAIDERSDFADNVPTAPSTSDLMPAAATQSEKCARDSYSASTWTRPGPEVNTTHDPADPFVNYAETNLLSVSHIARPCPADTSDGSILVEPPHPSPNEPDLEASTPIINPAELPPVSLVLPSPDVRNIAAVGHSKGNDGSALAMNGVKTRTLAQDYIYSAHMDFVPSMEDELEIRTGQLLPIKHKYDDGRALREVVDGSISGVVPHACISKTSLQPRLVSVSRRGFPARPGPLMHNDPDHPEGIPCALMPGGGRNFTSPSGRSSPDRNSTASYTLPYTRRKSPPPFAWQPRPTSPGAGADYQSDNNNGSPYVAYWPTTG